MPIQCSVGAFEKQLMRNGQCEVLSPTVLFSLERGKLVNQLVFSTGLYNHFDTVNFVFLFS